MQPIRNRHGERLDCTLHPGRPDDRRIVVIGHGVTSHKDRPWLVALSNSLADAGIASLRFSFAGNGDSEGDFTHATISKEVDDLGAILDALAGHELIYAGHSMGAAVGVLRAATDQRIRRLISLAGMTQISRFMETWFGHLHPGRDVMFAKPHCRLTAGFLADAHTYHDTLRAAAEISVPWLLVHGTGDELVPWTDAQQAQQAAHDRPTLVTIAGADHRFAGYESSMADTVVAWLTHSNSSSNETDADVRGRPESRPHR